MRVLIADDQRSFGTTLAEMVRYCGHEVVAIVGSGLEAIQAFSLHRPDLVLMDHWMPRLNGVTASRHIIAKYPSARVVLLSAWSPLDGADESGAMCFLPKPVDMARLSATLLTVSQSIAPLPIFEETNFGHCVAEPMPVLADASPAVWATIPPEIISPIETFPVATFPIEDSPATPIFETVSVAPEKKTARKRRARKKRVSAKKAA